jgi:hypothetical protein
MGISINPTVRYGGRFNGPSSPGAGRFVDFMWPSPQNYQMSTFGTTRNSPASTPVGCAVIGINGGGGSSVQGTSGVPTAYLQSSAVVGNGNAITLNPARVLLNTNKSIIDPTCNDIAVWRVIWNAAMFAPPAVTGESGLYMLTDPNQTKLVTGASSGWGFRYLSDGSVVFVVSQGGVPTNTTVLTNSASEELHSFECRMYSATRFAEARLEVFVDGLIKSVPANCCTWGAGSKLPGVASTTVASATIGFLPGAVNVANIVNALRINMIRVIAGPTLLSCL